MRKIILDALIFSIDDYLAVQEWSQTNHGIFHVNMPPGIACAPLTSVIYHPDIFDSNADGVLVADHRKYSEQQIAIVVGQLEWRDKQLYSTANGLQPVGHGSTDETTKYPCFLDTPILKVLNDCRPALCWLACEGPTQVVPAKHAATVKCLENLGLVFRRNNKTVSLRRHRLRRVLEHESSKLTVPCTIEELLQT